MFSLFRKKKPSTPAPQPKNSAERSLIRSIYGNAFEKTLSDSQVQELSKSIQQHSYENELQNAERKQAQRNRNNLQRILNEQAAEEAAIAAAEEAARLLEEKKAKKRTIRLNTLTRKHSYISKQNLLNNAIRQRRVWREKNPSANYMSIENFANSNFFIPHNLYTGTTNNNASTITLNSPRSIYSNESFGGTRRKTRRRSKY